MIRTVETRKRLAPSERRARIITSARAALVKGGLRGFGVAAVAKEAGVAIGLIGHYFGGIDGLIKALMQSVVASKQTVPTEAPETLEKALSDLRNIVEQNFHPGYYNRDNLVVWLPIYELATHDLDMRSDIMQRDGEDSQEMELVLAVICNLRGKAADPAEVSKLFFTLLDGLWLRWCYSGRPEYAEEKRLAIGFLETHIGPFYNAAA